MMNLIGRFGYCACEDPAAKRAASTSSSRRKEFMRRSLPAGLSWPIREEISRDEKDRERREQREAQHSARKGPAVPQPGKPPAQIVEDQRSLAAEHLQVACVPLGDIR